MVSEMRQKKTAKELKGITTGIDELTIIDQSTDSSSGSGSGGGYSSDSFDMGSLADTSALDETDSKMQALIDRMKELQLWPLRASGTVLVIPVYSSR